MYKQKLFTIFIMMVMLLSLLGPSFGVSARPLDATSPTLGAVETYSVLAGSIVTNTGSSVISGDVGVSPSVGVPPHITGFPPGIINLPGAQHDADSNAGLAQAADTAAFLALSAAPNVACDGHDWTGTGLIELSGRSLVPGVYCADAFNLNGTLTLDDTGAPDGVWIFRSAARLDTTSGVGAKVQFLTGVGSACNVWWKVVSSATIGVGTAFIGNILASTSIALQTNATLNGRALAQTGAVTLDTNTISGPACRTTTATTLSAASVTTGTAVHDNATLTGTNSSIASGSVTYNVYSNNTCTTLVTSSGAKTFARGAAVPASGNISFSSTGTYYWQAVYGGDSNNMTSTSPCGDEVLTVTSPPAPAATGTPTGGVLPGTGFAPQRVTSLPAQSTEKAYSNLGDLWLEIPRLGVQMPIVGVPQTNGEWEVSWLGNDAGWLNGTAFPTYSGNSVLAGHVYNADGTPGPFVHLNGLWWGDQVIVHAWGAQYVYEVRSVLQVSPYATSSVITHKDLPWVTLITCRGFDEASNSYKYRIAVGAVLVDVK